MDFNLVAAIVAGCAGTAAMTAMMMVAPMMGMPKMDMPNLLSLVSGKPGDKRRGMVIHFVLGVVFALVYALLFKAIDSDVIILGVIIGAVHGLALAMMMGQILGVFIKKVLNAPVVDNFLPSSGGMMGIAGMVIGHAVFGLVVGIVYKLVAEA
jgi:hypothetical protein